MTIETTRRAILAGVPAAAVAVAIPATAFAASSEEWERAKADYIAAAKRFDAAVDDDNRADSERIDFGKTAPEQEVTYTEDGWTVATDDMQIEAAPREARFALTRHNFDSAASRKQLAGTAGYAAFAVKLAAWRERRDAMDRERGWTAAGEEWEAANDAHSAAWKALVACPVAAAAHIAEKASLARGRMLDEDDVAQLLDAITADLHRLTPN